MFFIGILLFICTVFFAMGTGGLRAFIDPSSIVFVLFSNVALLVATRSIKSFVYGIRVISSKKIKIEKEKLMESIEVYDLLQKAFVGIGMLGFIIGIISLLHVLDGPSSIGPAMDVSLLTVFYSTLFGTLFITPTKFLLKKKAREQ